MAQAQAAARFMTEVAPPQIVSIVRRRKLPRSLETIAEDDREQLASYGADRHQTACWSGFAAAWVRSRAPSTQERERAGGYIRELSRYFSDDHHGQGGSWESSRLGKVC